MKLWTIPDEIDFYKMGREDYIVKVFSKSEYCTLPSLCLCFQAGTVSGDSFHSYFNNRKCRNCHIPIKR